MEISKIQKNTNLKIWDKENSILILLFIISIFVVYFLPFVVSIAFFFIFLSIISFNSNKDYFWIAFFFLILDPPGQLFDTIQPLSSKQIPFIPLVARQVVNFKEIIPFIFLIKAILIKGIKKYNFVFKQDFKLLFLYFVIVLFFSILNFEIYYGKYYRIFVMLGYWSLLYSLPKLLDYEQIIKIDKLLFPFVFVAFALQIFAYFSGKELINIFNQNYVGYSLTIGGFSAARISSNIYIVLYCFLKALFYYFSPKKEFPNYYTLMIIIISNLSILLTAARSWILATLIIMLLVLIFQSDSVKKLKKIFSTISFFIIIIFFVFSISPKIRLQSQKSVERVVTLSYLAEGDLTAGGTLARLTSRRYPMEKKFKERPVFGWGFSDDFFEFDDHHVGMLIILLNVGIVGLVIFILFLFKWIFNIWKYSQKGFIKRNFGKSILTFAFALIYIFILHSTSHTMWGFYWPGKQDMLMFILLLVSLNAVLLESSFLKRNTTGIKKTI
jgi:hypothetical protein